MQHDSCMSATWLIHICNMTFINETFYSTIWHIFFPRHVTHFFYFFFSTTCDALPRYDAFPTCATTWPTHFHNMTQFHDITHFLHLPQHTFLPRCDAFPTCATIWRISTIWHISYMCYISAIWHSATLPRCDTFPTCATITSHTARGDSFLNVPRYDAFLCGSCLYGMPCGNGTIFAIWHISYMCHNISHTTRSDSFLNLPRYDAIP